MKTNSNSLRNIPDIFNDCGIQEAMKTAGPFILNFVQKRLRNDPDIAAEFLVYFYERFPVCISKFRKRPGIPFTGFFIRYIRNEFMNFIRKRNLRTLKESLVNDFGTAEELHFSRSVNAANMENLRYQIGILPASLRIPLKLYYGLQLDLKELHAFTMHHNDPASAADFLKEISSRHSRFIESRRKLVSRCARLNYLIHSREELDDRYRKLCRMKKNADKKLFYFPPALSISELSRALGISRSTVCRRLQKARSLLEGQKRRIYEEEEHAGS